MKKLVLSFSFLALISLISCKGGDDNSGSAAVPQSPCGNNIPAHQCANYNPNVYNPNYFPGQYPGQFPGQYPNGYGCPPNFQPLYTGGVWMNSGMTCIRGAYFQSYYTNYGVTPYYNPSFYWGASVGGHGHYGPGPAQACDSYLRYSCGSQGAFCAPAFGQRFGFCVNRPY